MGGGGPKRDFDAEPWGSRPGEGFGGGGGRLVRIYDTTSYLGVSAIDPGKEYAPLAGGGPGVLVPIEDLVAEIIDRELHAANDADLTAGLGCVLDGDPEFLKRIASKVVKRVRG